MDGPFAGLMEKDVASTTTTLARLRSHRTGGAVPLHGHGSARNWHSLIEKIMSETNETSNLATLADSELDAVAGGVFDFGNIVAQANNATQVGLAPGGGAPAGPPDVWVGCAWLPQWW
jgi:hypothetical protein